jgi:hypothetical protein
MMLKLPVNQSRMQCFSNNAPGLTWQGVADEAQLKTEGSNACH